MVIFRDLVDNLQRRLEAEGKSGAQGGGSFGRVAVGAAQYVQHQLAAGQADVMRPPRYLERGGRRKRASAYGRVARLSYEEAAGGGGAGRFALRAVAVLAIAAVVFLGTSSTYITFASELPDARTLATSPPADDTLLYASDGSVIADVHQPGYEHYQRKLADMGSFVPQATVAIEDANFYGEPGVDVAGIARAAYVDWRAHGAVQGASTITQQLVKLRLLHDTSPTISRKLKEAVLALQVSQTYSKDQILEMYLNTVFYGNASYGIEAAAKNYFHTDTAHLDLAQASMLAGIPRDPTYANPFVNWEGAKARQYMVLQAMVQKTHVITQAQADKAFAEDLSPPQHLFHAYTVDSFPAFDSYVTSLLRAQYGDAAAYGGGLRVYTTLNPGLQAIANKAVLDNLRENSWRHFTQSALVSIDPHTGAIVAMVGSAGPGSAGGQYNFAVWPPRNPGSSMKIYNYTAAIASKKFTMVSPIVDSPLRMQQPDGSWWQPKNYDLKYHGVCQLQQCMGNSLNVPAVKVELGTGVSAVVEMARAMGAPPWSCHKWGSGGCLDWRDDDPLNYYGPALTLGSYGETVLQMATGASVLAAQGVLHPPIAYTKILNEDGSTLFQAHPDQTAKQVIDPGVAWIMETIMSNDNNRAMIFGRGSALTLPDYRVGAKTGTYDAWTDGWTLGYTPNLVSAVWSGNADGSPMVSQSDGVYVAAPAWHQYMDDALHYLHAPNDWYTVPSDVVTAQPGPDGIYFLPGTSAATPVPPMPPGVITSGGYGGVPWWQRGGGGAPPPPTGGGGGGHHH